MYEDLSRYTAAYIDDEGKHRCSQCDKILTVVGGFEVILHEHA